MDRERKELVEAVIVEWFTRYSGDSLRTVIRDKCDDPLTMEVIRFIASDNHSKVQGLAINALGAVQDRLAVDILATVAENEASFVWIRESAAKALASIGDPRAVEPLIRLAMDDRARQIRGPLLEALGTLGDARAIPLFREVLSRPASATDYKLKEIAVTALANLRDRDAIDVLLHTSGMQAAVAKAMKTIPGIQLAEQLLAALSDPDPRVRSIAARLFTDSDVLKSLSAPTDAIEPLINVLPELDYDAQQNVGGALMWLTGRRFMMLLGSQSSWKKWWLKHRDEILTRNQEPNQAAES